MTYMTDAGGSAPIYTCVHGGTWSGAGTANIEEISSSTLYLYKNSSLTSVTPCPATVPSVGVPACLISATLIATSTKKFDVSSGVPMVMGFDVQLSTSNGLPIIASAGVSTKAVGS